MIFGLCGQARLRRYSGNRQWIAGAENCRAGIALSKQLFSQRFNLSIIKLGWPAVQHGSHRHENASSDDSPVPTAPKP